MKLNRRRFLSISAVVSVGAAIPLLKQEETVWHGLALGAQASIKIYGDKDKAKSVLDEVVRSIRFIEKQFSLYDPNSSLSQLNKNRKIINASVQFRRLMSEVDQLNQLTQGLFDPTVQSYFEYYSDLDKYQSLEEVRQKIGWRNVSVVGKDIFFKNNSTKVTLNGIAQGFATDIATEILQSHGLANILVNVGEYRAGDSEKQFGIADHNGNLISRTSLRNNAIATSSPFAYRIKNGATHVLSPQLGEIEPFWKTVSVVSKTATWADAISTALVLTKDTSLAQSLVADNHIQRVVFEDVRGKVTIL